MIAPFEETLAKISLEFSETKEGEEDMFLVKKMLKKSKVKNFERVFKHFLKKYQEKTKTFKDEVISDSLNINYIFFKSSQGGGKLIENFGAKSVSVVNRNTLFKIIKENIRTICVKAIEEEKDIEAIKIEISLSFMTRTISRAILHAELNLKKNEVI